MTLETVKLAIELGVDVNVANAEGNTALHAAASRGYGSVISFLVQKGAKLDVANKKGETPLASVSPSRKDIVLLLRKLGAKE